MPGARPTINSCAVGSPNDSTGALYQPGSRARICARKLASRGQSGQLRSGTAGEVAALAISATSELPGAFSIVEIVVAGAARRHGGRALQKLWRVMARLARRGTLGGIAAELG